MEKLEEMEESKDSKRLLKKNIEELLQCEGWKILKKFMKEKANDQLMVCVNSGNERLIYKAQGVVQYHKVIGEFLEECLSFKEDD